MASSSSCAVESDDAQLKALFETFCYACSLEDIAFAYSKAGHNVEKAAEILCDVNNNQTQDSSHNSNCKTSFMHSNELPGTGNPADSSLVGKISNGRKPKRASASVGSVSSFIGKTYFQPTSSLNESSRTTKPLKFNMPESLIAESGTEKSGYKPVAESGTERSGYKPVAEQSRLDSSTKPISISNKDLEEFLFSMLGDGFKLSRDHIHEVLGNCGYNVQQSMEELFSSSAKTLGIDKAVDHNSHRISRTNEETSCYDVECKKLPSQGYSKDTSLLNEEKVKLSKEVLESLFSVPDIVEEEPKVRRLELGLNRTRVIGQKPVTKPFDDYDLSPTSKTELTQCDSKKDDDEDYQLLRNAAKQHWDTMKLYYEAAVNAFTKGEHAQSSYCLEQGKHYYQLARQADEKSSELILEERESDEKGDELPLDLHAHSANESIRLLKLHLLSLANIPSFSYLKVTISADNDNTSRAKRKRVKVLQFLEKKSIRWSELESSPGIILIPLNELEHSKLTSESNSS